MNDLGRWQGLLGCVVILGVACAMSERRRAVSMRAVLGGLALQSLLGAFLLRVEAGRVALDLAAAWVESILACAAEGARFVFGAALVDPAGPAGFVFAFRVLPTIIFVSALFSVLYHLGVMQVVVRGVAWLTARVLGSSGAETLNAAASIFLGQTEAPLVIRPYLARLTRSELAVVMVSGMALVSGGILGAYIGVGCAPRDLIVAILMTFPATIFLTKIVIPETETPETLGNIEVAADRPDANVLAAAARGTREGLVLAANVAAVLVAFIGLVSLVNLAVGHCGAACGWPGVSLQSLLGAALAPVAWLLGVPWRDCPAVGGLLGTRTVLNELIAYGDLGSLAGALTPKSFSLATIALCGFANISSIGIQVGGIGALVPERQADLARLGVKVLVISTLANFLSAAIAGILL